ncbi:hypothetical protein ACA910_012902 [Epithemia clementina (nom. ined.)]
MSFDWNSDNDNNDDDADGWMSDEKDDNAEGLAPALSSHDITNHPSDANTATATSFLNEWKGDNDYIGGNIDSDSENSNSVDWEDAEADDPQQSSISAADSTTITTGHHHQRQQGQQQDPHFPKLKAVTINLHEDPNKNSSKQERERQKKKKRRRNVWKHGQLSDDMQDLLLQLQCAHILSWISHVIFLSSSCRRPEETVGVIPSIELARAMSLIPNTFWNNTTNNISNDETKPTTPTLLMVRDFCTWYTQHIQQHRLEQQRQQQQQQRRSRGRQQQPRKRQGLHPNNHNGQTLPPTLSNHGSPLLSQAAVRWIRSSFVNDADNEDILGSRDAEQEMESSHHHCYQWDGLFSNLLCCALMRHAFGWRVRWCMALDNVIKLDLTVDHPWLLINTRNVVRWTSAVAAATGRSNNSDTPDATANGTNNGGKRKPRNGIKLNKDENSIRADINTTESSSSLSPFLFGWMEVLCITSDDDKTKGDATTNSRNGKGRQRWIHVDVSHQNVSLHNRRRAQQPLFQINQPQSIEAKLSNLENERLASTSSLGGNDDGSSKNTRVSLQPSSTCRGLARRNNASCAGATSAAASASIAFVLAVEHCCGHSCSGSFQSSSPLLSSLLLPRRCTDVTPRYAGSRIATLQRRGLSRLEIQRELASQTSQQSLWWSQTLQTINQFFHRQSQQSPHNTATNNDRGVHCVSLSSQQQNDNQSVESHNANPNCTGVAYEDRKPVAKRRGSETKNVVTPCSGITIDTERRSMVYCGAQSRPGRLEGLSMSHGDSEEDRNLCQNKVQKLENRDSPHSNGRQATPSPTADIDAFDDMEDEEEGDIEFSNKADNEPMPTSKSGFANHPAYVLKSQLGKTHVISPSAKVCGLFAGESVYLRRDVSTAIEPHAWLYRRRKVKSCELDRPVIRLPPKKKPAAKNRIFQPLATYGVGVGNDGSDAQRAKEVAAASLKEDDYYNNRDRLLYAKWQTEPWSPPPVGRDDPIPLNEYKNVELALINPGLVHVDIPGDAVQAAKVLGVPYAPCLIGFGNTGHGTPVIRGIVVHSHNAVMIEQAAAQIRQHKDELEQSSRERMALRRWKKLMHGILIKQRVEREYGKGESSDDEGDHSVVHLD